MSKLSIRDYIKSELNKENQEVALDFIKYLEDNNLEIQKDDVGFWKDKIYYWVLYNNSCVAFIAIKDPEEPNNDWTIYSDDISPNFLIEELIDDKIKEIAYKHVDSCRCSGGPKKIFGKEFEWVCRTNFKVDNGLVTLFNTNFI